MAKYALSRRNIMNLIYDSPITKDGYYYFPNFNTFNEMKGDVSEPEYYYPRLMFRNRVYFDTIDCLLYLSRKKFRGIHPDYYRAYSEKFYEMYKGYKTLGLKDKIPEEHYSLEELIDNFEFINKHKYDN